MKKLLILMGLCFSGFSPLAFGGISTTTLNAGAVVLGACSTITASNMAFGNYNPASILATTQLSTITVTCGALTNYTIALNVGTTPGATFSNRQMANGANRLSYNLYTNVLHTAIWGDGTSGTSTVGGTSLGVAIPVIVYGEIPAGQNSAVGNYSDTVTATVSF